MEAFEPNGNKNYELEKFKILREHVWQYFQLHANQRIVLFRYYIIFFSLIAAGASFLFMKFSLTSHLHEMAAICLDILFIVITRIFWCLDTRNRQLIHFAEDALKVLEETALPGLIQVKKEQDKRNLKIFARERDEKTEFRHTLCFRKLFNAAYIAAIVYLIAAICYLFSDYIIIIC